MDAFKIAANKGCGPGGQKCPCCKTDAKSGYRRAARRRLKMELRKIDTSERP